MGKRRSKWEDGCPILSQYEWSFELMDYILVKREINPAYRGPELVDPKTGEPVTEFRMSADEKRRLKCGRYGVRWFREKDLPC